MSRLWDMHGLVVRCDAVDLDSRHHPDGDRTPDVICHLEAPGPVAAYGQVLPGRVLAEIDHGPDVPALTVVEDGDVDEPGGRGVVGLHFRGRAFAEINADRDQIRLRLAPDVDPDMASVLLGGTIISTLLALRGHPVLHASAVVPGDRLDVAVGFVGSSGMGKSTTATLACRDGASLLADDVLRTDVRADGAWAFPGATAARLRPAARALGAEAGSQRRETADDRLAVSLSPAAGRPTRLAALVIPRPDRRSPDLTLTRLGGMDAMLTLASHPRILGWTDPRTKAEAHEHWGALARTVPVFLADIPWGPPFASGLGSALLEKVLDGS